MVEKKNPKFLYVLIFVASCTLFPLFELVHHIPGQDLLEVAQYASRDLEFNDLYYGTNANDYSQRDAKSVVLINIGCFPVDSVRRKLVEILPMVDSHGPKSIGLDLHFMEGRDSLTDVELGQALLKHVDVLGKYRNESAYFDSLAKKTNKLTIAPVEVPGITPANSVRKYFYELEDMDKVAPSFGRALYEKSGYDYSDDKKREPEFMLEYVCTQNGYYDALSTDVTQEARERDFPAIEAAAFFNAENSTRLDSLLKEKIVIVGWLGSGYMKNPYDIQDKFKVPVNDQLVDRFPNMPGAVIHACAVEMFLHDVSFNEIEGVSKYLLNITLLLIFYLGLLLIDLKERLINELFVFVWNLGFLLLFIWLAGIVFMSKGIYFRVGELLILIPVLSKMLSLGKKVYKEYLRRKERKTNNPVS